MKISPARVLNGTVSVPGDKSVSHRAVMLGAIAEGRTRITNFSPGEDCASTIKCMRQLGVRAERTGTDVLVDGVGKNGLKKPYAPLDCGNSGTTMRLLAGILAGQDFESVLTGDESLCARPMLRIIEPLTMMGANITSSQGTAPLTIRGGGLRGIKYSTPVPSAQIKSCVLLAGLFADGETTVNEATKTRDHTERMLKTLGVEMQVSTPDGVNTCSVSGNARLTARDIRVPGDISSGAFFMVAAACFPGSELTLKDVGINPTRSSLVDCLRDFGVNLEISNVRELVEPTADITVRGGTAETGAVHILSGDNVAKMIDEIPILAVLGTQLSGGLEIRGAGELRHKESDRIKSIVDNLRAMGARVSEFEDGLRVEKSQLKGTQVDSRGDHRIAMAFAVAGLLASGETEILGAECADISYPGFFTDLGAVTIR